MTVAISKLLIQNEYITPEQYNYCHQLQQEQAVELRKPLVQLYLELGYCNIEHIEYCIKLRNYYSEQGQQESFQQNESHSSQKNTGDSSIVCPSCLSNCNSEWAICPFCGNSL